MDYARFNYVAQPGDGVTQFYPQIGEYDLWSIIYGYKLVPGIQDADEEKSVLNDWIKERSDNPVYRYGRSSRGTVDPSAQTEDLGDDSMIANAYGIENLKRIVPMLLEWTRTDGKKFEDMNEIYDQIFGQFRRYMGHVTSNVGGVKEDFKTYEQNEPVYVPASKDKQKRAISFLKDQLFNTPEWLVNADVISRKEANGNLDRIQTIQSRTLASLFSESRLLRMADLEVLDNGSSYPLNELFEDVEEAITNDLGVHSDRYRRNLHRVLIDRYENLLESKNTDIQLSDVPLLVRGSLQSIKKKAQDSVGIGGVSELHAQDIIARNRYHIRPKRLIFIIRKTI